MHHSTDDAFRPVFVVGAGRSGTTLLAELLARHTQVAIPPETQFFVGLRTMGVPPAQVCSREALAEVLGSLKRLADAQLDLDQLLASLGPQATPVELFRAVLETYTRRTGKSRPGEKTPGHLFHVPTLVQHYPDCRIVGIVRDPRDMAASYANVPFGPQTPLEAAVYWRHCTQRTLDLARSHPAQFMYVRYEDLLTDTENQLRRVDGFLGLGYEPGQLDPQQDTGVLVEWERQWKGKVKQPIDPTRAFAWKREMDEATALTITSVAAPLLEAVGYSDEPLRTLSWTERRGKQREAESAWQQMRDTILGRYLNEPLKAPPQASLWSAARRRVLNMPGLWRLAQ